MTEKKNLRLDLTDFNISLVEMLTFLKEKSNNLSDILSSSKEEKKTNPKKNIVINQNFEQEEKVDLTKLKLNIQALKEAVKTAKQSKSKKNSKKV
jgi:hypothetical protein